jgi:hypothetical protein
MAATVSSTVMAEVSSQSPILGVSWRSTRSSVYGVQVQWPGPDQGQEAGHESAQDDVLDHHREILLLEAIGGMRGEPVAQPQLPLGFATAFRVRRDLPGPDHPAVRIPPDVDAAIEPAGQPLSHRGLASGHDPRNHEHRTVAHALSPARLRGA